MQTKENNGQDHVLIRIDEVSKILGVGVSTAWRRVKEPDFPDCVRQSRRNTGWFRDELMAWLDSKRCRA